MGTENRVGLVLVPGGFESYVLYYVLYGTSETVPLVRTDVNSTAKFKIVLRHNSLLEAWQCTSNVQS